MQVETVLTGDPEGRADYRVRFECDGGRHCRLDIESAFRAISPIPFALALFDQEGLIQFSALRRPAGKGRGAQLHGGWLRATVSLTCPIWPTLTIVRRGH